MAFLKLIFLAVFLSESPRCPNPKHVFVLLENACRKDLHFGGPFRSFSPVSTQPYQNGQQSASPTDMFEVVLKLGHLRASMRNTARKIHKSSSNPY